MQTITPSELAAIRAEKGTDAAPIIDVREVDEVDVVRALGAVNIPMSTFLDRIGEVPTDGTVYVICHSGSRSAQVAQYLEQHGYDAVNVSGGTAQWEQSGLPVERGR